jgi:GntR family transcriptional regulator/MocR family aminotransferase
MARTRTLLDWLTLEPGSGQPLYRQIYERIRNAVVSGRISAGTNVPASRALASGLGVSRITVLQAYDQLIAEGFLESRAGSGTRVAALFSDEAGRREVIATSLYGERIDHAAPPTIQELAGTEPSVGLAFQPGIPAFDLFPRLVWSRLLKRHGQRNDQSALDYAHLGGYAPLRQAIAGYLVASRGVPCTPDQVVIASSARAATALVCGVLLEQGDTVVVEDPGYVTGRRCMEHCGMRIAPVPVDGQGLRVQEIAGRAPGARLAYVTPSHQWPTGATLSLQRRLELLTWARRHEAWVLEDDYDSEFRFSEAPLTALHGLADGERVVFLGTFSKVLAPSIRCAYLVVPADTARRFGDLAYLRGCEPPLHVQGALSDFISEGHFARHVLRMRTMYRNRRDRVLHGFAEAFGDRFRFRPLPGGLQLVADLAADLRAAEVQRRAEQQGICARDVAVYHIEAKPPNALQLGFAAVPEAEILPAAQRLHEAIADLLQS